MHLVYNYRFGQVRQEENILLLYLIHAYACYKHFTDEDIINHLTKWVLKNGAVPPQFDWSNKQNRKQHLLRVVPNAAVAVQPTAV